MLEIQKILLRDVPKNDGFRTTFLTDEGEIEVFARAGKIAVDSETGKRWRLVHIGFSYERAVTVLPQDQLVLHFGKPSIVALDFSAKWSGIRNARVLVPGVHQDPHPYQKGPNTLVPGTR